MMKYSSLSRTLFPVLVLAGCSGTELKPDEPGGDFEGIEEVTQGLTNLTTQCTWASPNATLVLHDGDVAMVNKLSSGALGVNGYACGGATTATLKKLSVTSFAGSSGTRTLILDYLGGTFAPGTATSVGVDVDFTAGAGVLKMRGTKLADKFTFGVGGITLSTTTMFKDISYKNVSAFVVTLSDGDDVFSGAGSTVTGVVSGSAALTAAQPITVYGGNGNDSLTGGDGDDILHGGPGNDTFFAGAFADGADHFYGEGGTDTADYSARKLVSTTGLAAAPTVLLLPDVIVTTAAGAKSGAGAPVVVTDAGALGDEGDVIAADITVLRGGSGNDTIAGCTGCILWGGPGNDTFDEGAVANVGEVINGEAGIDTVSYAKRTTVNVANTSTAHPSGWPNSILATIGLVGCGEAGENDKIMLDVENLTGGAGDDTLIGSVSDNVLDGGPGDDNLSGMAGNDTLRGGLGDDHLYGGAGDDIFDEGSATNGADVMVGGGPGVTPALNGVDTVDYSARGGTMVAGIGPNTLYIVMDGVTGSGQGTVTSPGVFGPGTGALEGDLIGADIENVIGGTGADTIYGNALDNQLEGSASALASLAVDHIYGLAGDDVIDGGGGNDVIDCGSGDDTVLDLSLSTVAGDIATFNATCEL
jgi:Ca2+-binding RTX toxin-like protein